MDVTRTDSLEIVIERVSLEGGFERGMFLCLHKWCADTDMDVGLLTCTLGTSQHSLKSTISMILMLPQQLQNSISRWLRGKHFQQLHLNIVVTIEYIIQKTS